MSLIIILCHVLNSFTINFKLDNPLSQGDYEIGAKNPIKANDAMSFNCGSSLYIFIHVFRFQNIYILS